LGQTQEDETESGYLACVAKDQAVQRTVPENFVLLTLPAMPMLPSTLAMNHDAVLLSAALSCKSFYAI
jgi:hypothetical protein